MEFQRNSLLKLSIVLVVMLNSVHSQLAGTDCNGKTYYCVDNQHFQVCVGLAAGKSQTMDDKVHSCLTGSFCDNAGKVECDSQTAAPVTTTSEAPSTTTTLPTTTTTTLATTTVAPFSCTQPGVFPNANDCHGYYTCSLLPWGLVQTTSSCLAMAFDPVLQRCTTDQSPCQSTFTCQSAGRFPDPADSKSYFWCLDSGSGYTLYHLSCAAGQGFDPIQGQCSTLLVVGGAVGAQFARMASPGRGGYNK